MIVDLTAFSGGLVEHCPDVERRLIAAPRGVPVRADEDVPAADVRVPVRAVRPETLKWHVAFRGLLFLFAHRCSGDLLQGESMTEHLVERSLSVQPPLRQP